MASLKSLVPIAKKVAKLSDIYWHDKYWNYRKEFAKAEKNWVDALCFVLENYLFKRRVQGSTYEEPSTVAVRYAIRNAKRPTQRFVEEAWDRFKTIVKESGWRLKEEYQPLNCFQSNGKVAVTSFVAELKDDNYNILLWARSMLRQGRAEEATRQLLRIGGVGDKIAAFFLRDVCRYHSLYEVKGNPAWCFQPADIWVKRVAQTWGKARGLTPALGLDGAYKYRPAVKIIEEVAKDARVWGGDLNAGSWFLCGELGGVKEADVPRIFGSLRGLDDWLKIIYEEWRGPKQQMAAVREVIKPLIS